MKKIVSILLALACVIGVFGAMSVSASAAEVHADVKELSKTLFQNVGTGEYLNFDYGILKNGTYVRVYPKDGSAEQLWDIVKVSENTYRIQTNKSSKYCLDVYRGSVKLKAGQLCDIWKTGTDAYAQDVVFYRCDNGNYVIRMAENPSLAIAATASKGRVKLVKFDATSKYQQWVIKDAKGNKIDASNSSADKVVGIPMDAYKKTDVEYTVNGVAYFAAETLRKYNGVEKGTLFFVDKKGAVVTDAGLLDKLYSLDLFVDIRENMLGAATSWADAAGAYYDVCTYVANSEKLGSLIGKTSGGILSICAGNTIGVEDAVIDIAEELASPETIKASVLMGMLRVYSNNAIVTGTQAANLMSKPVTDYDVMLKCVTLYSECSANFAAVEYLGGEQVREMAASSRGRELSKYFKNVFLGFADSIVPDIKSVEIVKYVTDGVVSLTDFAVNSGASAACDKKLAEYNKLTDMNFPSAANTANKLSQPESMTFVYPLTSNYKTNVTTQKWAAYYKGHGYHLGVDLGTNGNRSTNVVSIAEGVVFRVVAEKNSGGWGNLVIVEHTTPEGKKFYSGYGHLSKINVSVGITVEAGTKLGVMGSTGNSTGPHLHLLVFSGTLSKNAVPKGYTSSKISQNTCKVNGITYYNPMEVIATQGAIIK